MVSNFNFLGAGFYDRINEQEKNLSRGQGLIIGNHIGMFTHVEQIGAKTSW